MTDASPSRAHALIDAFERDPALDQPLRMRERTLALEWLEEWLAEAHHDASLRDQADLVVSLGALTWPHQLVRVMLGEQLYRATTILAGHPYHRG